MTTEAKELTPEQIWAEEAQKREGSPDKTAAPTAEVTTTTQTATEKPDDEGTNTNPDPDASAATGGDTGKVDTSQESKTESDTLAKILENLEKLEKRQRSVEGHIGGLRAEQNRLHTAMEAARKSTSTDGGNAPTKAEVDAAKTNPEEWEALKKDFPEWAQATEKLLEARLPKAASTPAVTPEEIERQVNERLAKASAEMRQEIVNTALNAVLPGWQKEVTTPKFAAWLNAQPDDVKELANSPEVSDAARMLRLYDSANKADPSAQIQQDRQKTLANAATLPKGRTPPATRTLDQMTEQEVWDLEAKRREELRAKRGY